MVDVAPLKKSETATAQGDQAALEQDLEALIEEARRRARRRRLTFIALVLGGLLAAGAVYLASAGNGVAPSSQSHSWHPQATTTAPDDLLRRVPYMGVACPTPNSFACDRVGLYVYLREPAVRVEARIEGRDFDLDVPDWVEAGEARARDFVGFLQPAGLLNGPLQLSPDATGGRWIGREPVSATVSLWVLRDDGAALKSRLKVPLMAGWG